MNFNSIGKTVFAFATAGLLALFPARTQGQATTLNITLTATYQNPTPKTSSNPDVTVSSTLTGKITSGSLIKLAGGGAAVPNGTALTYDLTSGAIGSTNKTGGFTDLSANLTITNDASGGNAVTSSSTASSDPVAQSTTTTAAAIFTFDDGHGNSFTLNGVIKTTVSLAKPDANGDPQVATISYSGNVSGWGSYLGNNAVFTGTISGSGKGASED